MNNHEVVNTSSFSRRLCALGSKEHAMAKRESIGVSKGERPREGQLVLGAEDFSRTRGGNEHECSEF